MKLVSRGSALIEFALAWPIVLLLVLGSVELAVWASEAAAGFTIQGTTSGVENGQTVTVTIVDSANPTVVLYTLTTLVTGNAWSLTVTPTYQYERFFARAEFSYIGANHTAAGSAFGASGTKKTQARLLAETGFLF